MEGTLSTEKRIYDPEVTHIVLPQLAAGGSGGAAEGEQRKHGLRLVLISDTHGMHRKMTIPDGDVLIHGGDFTRHGKLEDAVDFNAWLGELPHARKLVVYGNHECNSDWARGRGGGGDAAHLLSNATLLLAQSVVLPSASGRAPLKVWGENFFWPMREGEDNPHFGAIPDDCDVIIAHGPARGYVDGSGSGCESLARHVLRVRPRMLVSGHIHGAHGAVEHEGTLYANAASARRGHGDMGWEPIIVDV